MKISELINLLIFFKKEHGDIEVKKIGNFIGSDTINTGFVFEDNLILADSEKEKYLTRLMGEYNDE